MQRIYTPSTTSPAYAQEWRAIHLASEGNLHLSTFCRPAREALLDAIRILRGRGLHAQARLIRNEIRRIRYPRPTTHIHNALGLFHLNKKNPISA